MATGLQNAVRLLDRQSEFLGCEVLHNICGPDAVEGLIVEWQREDAANVSAERAGLDLANHSFCAPEVLGRKVECGAFASEVIEHALERI